jgi:hypothetical protein
VGRKMTKQKRALILLILIICAFVTACVEFSKTHYANGLSASLFVLAFVLWLVMTQVRSHCGVLNADGRTYCRNRITGLFFGCHRHTWQRPLSYLGIGNRPASPSTPTGPTSRAPAAAAASTAIPQLTSDQRERRRNGILFYVTICSLVVASMSTFTDVYGFIKDIT